MSWAFIALSLKWRRRLLLALLALVVVSAFVAAYALGAKGDACDPPPLEEVSEAYMLDHPECLDGGAR
jgi:hypothetical protein